MSSRHPKGVLVQMSKDISQQERYAKYQHIRSVGDRAILLSWGGAAGMWTFYLLMHLWAWCVVPWAIFAMMTVVGIVTILVCCVRLILNEEWESW